MDTWLPHHLDNYSPPNFTINKLCPFIFFIFWNLFFIFIFFFFLLLNATLSLFQQNGNQNFHGLINCDFNPPLTSPCSITIAHQANPHPSLLSPIPPPNSVSSHLCLPYLCFERRCRSPDTHSHGPLPPRQSLSSPSRPRGTT